MIEYRKGDPFLDVIEGFFGKSNHKNTLRNFNDTNDGIKKRNEISENLPSANLLETNGDYRYEIMTPGFSKENIKISMDGEMLTIKGEKTETKENDSKYLSKEFHSQKFYRSFKLPENVVLDEVYAKVKDGVTTLYLPKEKLKDTKKIVRDIEIL